MKQKIPINTVYKISNLPFSIALLPDFHGGDEIPILRSLESHHPDLITIPGDLIYGSLPEDEITSPLDTQPGVLKLLQGCTNLAPTYLGTVQK